MPTVVEGPVQVDSLAVRRRCTPDPRLIVLIVSGAGEAMACEQVTGRLLEEGAVVYESEFVPAPLADAGSDVVGLVEGVREVRMRAVAEHPGLPVVLVGNSSGTVAVTTYADRYPDEVQGLVFASPKPYASDSALSVA